MNTKVKFVIIISFVSNVCRNFVVECFARLPGCQNLSAGKLKMVKNVEDVFTEACIVKHNNHNNHNNLFFVC